MYQEIIKVLEKEIEFYSNKENPDWSKDKNEGFREGIKNCYELIKCRKQIENI